MASLTEYWIKCNIDSVTSGCNSPVVYVGIFRDNAFLCDKFEDYNCTICRFYRVMIAIEKAYKDENFYKLNLIHNWQIWLFGIIVLFVAPLKINC